MGCLGGGEGGKSEFGWSNDMEPYMRALMPMIQSAGLQGYQQYGGQRIAPINGDENTAMEEIRNMNLLTDNPLGAINGAMHGTEDVLNGKYLNGDGANPYSRNNPFSNTGNQYIGNHNSFIDQSNPYAQRENDLIGKTNPFAQTGNEFIGENPYYESVKNRGMGDIAKNYREAIDPGLKGDMVLNGTLGGGAEQQLRSKNEEALVKQLGDYGAQMDNQQYDRSANLRGQDLSRMGATYGEDLSRNLNARGQDLTRMGNQWGTDMSRRGDLEGQDFSRNMTGQEAQLNRQGNLYDSFLNRGSQNYENERGRQMQAIQYGNDQQGLGFQRAGQLSTVGDFRRGVDQQYNDQAYQDFVDQRDWGRNQLGWLSGQYSTAMGGSPMPNQQFTQPSNNWGNGLGSMLAAYGMFRA